MKIMREHFETLKTGITEKHNSMLQLHFADYNKYLRDGHSTTRIGFDLLHAAGLTPFVCDTLYKYMDDTHIATAVKKIVSTLKGVQS